MLAENTTIIRNTTLEEISILKSELEKNDHKWQDHFDRQRHDTDGLSIHLAWSGNFLEFIMDDWPSFPETKKILDKISGNKTISRCYWHRLLKGQDIKRHLDANWFITNKKISHRYQIYLETDSENELRFDDCFVDAKNYEYTVVDFSLQNYHSYKNNTDIAWYFLVFDVLEDGIHFQHSR